MLGRHRGIVRYTVGQRRGLGIAAEHPLYVKEIRPSDNVVVLGEDREMYSQSLIAGNFNWISGDAPAGEIRVNAKIRYRQPEQPARVRVLPDGRVRILFDTPQRAVTPGQAAVLYDGDTVLGGGVIER